MKRLLLILISLGTASVILGQTVSPSWPPQFKDLQGLPSHNPTFAVATPAADKMPIASGSGLLDAWITVFAGSVEGLVPSSTGGTTTFLRADGAWGSPPGASYTFTDSLVNTAGTVSLVNDSASPGASKVYGTDGTGARGWQTATSGGNASYPTPDVAGWWHSTGAGVYAWTTPTYTQVGALGASQTAVDSAKLNGQLPSYYQTALGFTPVPNTRTVNSKALSTDISLTYADVGALASGGTAVNSTQWSGKNYPTSAAGWLHDNGSGTLTISVPTYSDVGALAAGGTATNSSQLEGHSASYFQIAGSYEPAITAGTSSQYWRGDKTWQTINWLTSETDPSIPSKTGHTLQYLRVNAGETALEWATPSGSGNASYPTPDAAGWWHSTGAGVYAWTTPSATDVGLGNVPNVDATNPANITQDATHRFATDTEKSTWNGKEPAISSGTTAQYWRGDKSWQTLDKSAVGLSSVENTALSTWTGAATIATVGTIATGTWNATAIADSKIASALTGKTYNGLTPTAQSTGYTLAGGTTSKTLTVDTTVATSTLGVRTINFIIDGGGSAITTGSKGFVTIDFPCTVTAWTILANASGSCVVDVKRSTYAGFPTTSSIAGSELPTLASVQKNQDTALTTWTTAISSGDVLEFIVNSASTVTRVTVALRVTVP